MSKLTLVRDDGAGMGFELGAIPADEVPAVPVLTRSAPVLTPAAPVLTPSAAAPTPFGAPLAAANQAAVEIPAATWPGAVPSSAAAEALLLSAVAGRASADASQLAGARRVLAAASEHERAALSGAHTPVDPVFLRSAAALRLRLDLALASLPAAGRAVDQTAAQQLLADVDGALAQLKAVGATAPPGVMPALEPTRRAIVDGGVQLAGALSRLVPAGEAPPAARAMPAIAPDARVLSNEAEAGNNALARKGIWIPFAIVLAIVAGYHGWRLATRPAPTPPSTFAGAPSNTTGITRGPVRLLTLDAGKKMDPEQLEKFRAQEQAKGNTVREISPGAWVIEPVDAARGRAKP